MTERHIQGRAAAPGIALGTLACVDRATHERTGSGNAKTEDKALRNAISGALADLRRLVDASTSEGAEILGFQVALLEDDVLAEPAFTAIAAGRPAHDAWRDALAAEAADYESSDNEYFRARASDLRDIADRVLANLNGSDGEANVPPGAIVAAIDLAPSRFLAIDWSRGGALALTGGSTTSHLAMLARSRRVPTIVGLGVDVSELHGRALVDANRGVLVLDPGPELAANYERDARAAAIRHVASEAAAKQAAITADGTRIRVLLNIADPAELDGIDPAICDGIGLVRTELLFHTQHAMPDEAQQFAVYRRIAEWAQGRPVTIRTLDAGGDKPIAGLTFAAESNPFLGVRGLRLSFARPEVFRVQLRAIARAAAGGNVKVMLPMVTLPQELDQARAMLDQEIASLRASGVPAARPSLGIMIEVPAAAITADLFDAEFFSIGSNDLTQYVAAAGRDVDALARLADPVQPAMLRLIRHVVDAAEVRGIDASLCGDAGGEPRAIPLLLGAGLRSLSMAPAFVGPAKLAICATRLSDVPRVTSWRM